MPTATDHTIPLASYNSADGLTAMSVADWFQTFQANLAITNGDDISYRYKRITGRDL